MMILSKDFIFIKKGKQVLDGRKSEQFVRYRKGNLQREGYEDGDIGRIEAQLFFKEFINQKLKAKYTLKAVSIFLCLENMRTNIEIDDIEFCSALIILK